jgi:dTDP-4-dehydrorhamnose reductase
MILGASGYIGSAVSNTAEELGYNVMNVSRSKDFDYTDPEQLRNFISMNWNTSSSDFTTKGCTIINCAGYTGKPNVDRCEIEKEDTILGNIVFPAELASVCRERGLTLAHISSGCIYDGYHKAYTEDDPPNFSWEADRHNWKSWQPKCSFYSGSKALAEKVLADSPYTYIFRLRIPFDEHQSARNYITKVLRYDKLLDEVNSFSHRRDFAKSILDLIHGNTYSGKPAPYGTYNITNNGSISTKEVIDMIVKILGPKKSFQFYDDIDSFNEDVIARRSNCVLDTGKMEEYVSNRTVREAFKEAIQNYVIRTTD